jgi:hypothetical protein
MEKSPEWLLNLNDSETSAAAKKILLDMTITRQYITPNCVLVVEGLSDGATNNNTNNSQSPISILLNAEFRFMGLDKTIKGGLTFFESILDAVNTHAQECLSGLHHPPASKDKNVPQIVSLEKLEAEDYHRLTVKPEPDSNRQPVAIDLNPVQMFDLMEVVDQFFADDRVLPNLTATIQPLHKRYRHEEEPVAQRAIPISLGIGSLALAAGLIVMMPLPQIRKPEPVNPTNPAETVPNTNKLPTPPTVPNDKTTDSKKTSPTATPTASPTTPTTPKSTNAPTPKTTTTTKPEVKSTNAPTPKTTNPESKVKPTPSPTPRTKEAAPEKPTTSQ